MKKNDSILTNWGIVLALAGICCMAMVKGVIGKNLQILSITSVVLTILFLLKGVDIRFLKRPTKSVMLIFSYSLVTLIMCLISEIDVMQSGYGFIYQTAYFIEIYLIWNVDNNINLDRFVDIAFWLCGVFCAIAVLLFMKEGINVLSFNNYVTLQGDYLCDREATGTLSFLTFIMALVYYPKTKLEKLCKAIFMLEACVVLIISSRRSVYIAVILCLIFHIKNIYGTKKYNKRKFIKGVFCFVLGIGAFFIVCELNHNIVISLESAWERLVNGIMTLIGANNSDQSAAIRTSAASIAWKRYWNETSVFKFIFGSGFMSSWVDIPLLQAFVDLGIVGGITFFIIQFIIPITHIIEKSQYKSVMVAQYLTILSMVEGVANSFPYGHFFSIMLLLTLDARKEYSRKINLLRMEK